MLLPVHLAKSAEAHGLPVAPDGQHCAGKLLPLDVRLDQSIQTREPRGVEALGGRIGNLTWGGSEKSQSDD